ncbi:thioredoxin family protein [Kurthia sibirica]|uniref:Thiol reductase thioredoxin n=1 Tax=Kurthia sibirica TaxID=202750 RepID=A0A2U3ANY8_9BACL|nr:thioredoxin family protein [Kurthia sibirica]PWI26247.1 thiol reductase thioredoxin [Kurthia sibirica]GEK33861.1 thiol reductase thioredoxin [Kurthia sibirica]
MNELQSTEQFNILKNKDKTIFVFSADWCPDCRFIEPFMPAIEAKYPEFTFILVDRDKCIDLCIALDVFGIPSFVAFKDGLETGRFVSKERKTQAEIEAFIEAQ